MVSVRRPAARGGKARSSGGGFLATCVAYGKFVLLGGILVFVTNTMMGGNNTSSQVPPSKSSILELERNDQNLLRNMPDNSNHNQAIGRMTPPNNVEEHLVRRQHDEPVDHDEEVHRNAVPPPQQKQMQVHPNHEEEKLDPAERLSGEDEEPAENNGDDETDKSQKIQYISPNGEVLEKPEGTGPTKLGFVMDFVHERANPKFRKDPIAIIETSRQSHAQIVGTALSETNVQPCEYFSDASVARPKLYQHKVCRDPEQALVVYNAHSFPRTWCGVSIPPKSALRMEDHLLDCKEPVHLLERDSPPPSGEGMSPIVVHSQPDGTAPAADSLEDVGQCSIPCKMETGMAGISRFVQGTDWKIYQSDADPNTHKDVQIELWKYKHDEYYSSAYFKSDIPLSRIDITKHNLRDRESAVDFDSTLDKGVYIVSDVCGGTNSRRTRWLENLEAKYHIDSLGQCQHTAELEVGDSIATREGRVAIMKKYKFNLGFEVSTHKDWISETSFEAMLSGAVPIVLGASNANTHYPRNSAIFVSDFNGWDKLIDFVLGVAKSKEKWESYHKWRDDEALLAAFERKYEFTKTSPDCRLCSWAYAKMYGLGWDHGLQKVQDTFIPRKLCIDETSRLVAQPFQEIWSEGSTSSLNPPIGAADSCKTMTALSETKLEKDDWSVTKSMIQHDGVTDITIHDVQSTGEEITLTFSFKDVNNTEGAFFSNSHTLVGAERGMLVSSATIQDHKSKVTVLANWETKVWSPQQGLIHVVVQAKNAPALHSDEVRRIRLITEDMGQLHDKMTEFFPSTFSRQMILDFVDPLEVFYLDS